ncbi:phosphoadenosine phosphosulfate reductase [Micromonospora aurantiaca (nom. illeg.)]|uniref:phosphoadenosine phosphosulfate reductase n=1 Tax=Micromonospora aurantiaca (nom. illeg.) TaxID=47850 RepID=UPI0033F3FAC0
MTELRAFSYGGGIQSTASLVLAARGVISFRTFLFANVGDDSEDPETLTYVETLYGRLTREGSRSLPIPVRMDNGAPGTRSCTADFKIRVVGGWLKEHGASEDNPATVGIGISLDEIDRVNNRIAQPYEIPVYPLLDHQPPLRRQDCERVILAEPLPAHIAAALRPIVDTLPAITRSDLLHHDFTQMPRPPKSSCWFCPFHKPSVWAEMRRDRPEVFERACQLEALLNRRRDLLGRDHVYLTRFAKPLAKAIPVAQDMLPGFEPHHLDDATCDNGACFT